MFILREAFGKILAAATVCLLTGGAALAEPPVDRSALSVDENVTINTACFAAHKNGDEAFDRCVREQVDQLKDHPTPPDSGLSKTRSQAIERDCGYLRRTGIGQYNDCLRQAMARPAPAAEPAVADDPPPDDVRPSGKAPAAKAGQAAAAADPPPRPTVVVLVQPPAAAAAKAPPAAVSGPTYIMLPPGSGSAAAKSRRATAAPRSRPARATGSASAPAPTPPIIITTAGQAQRTCTTCRTRGSVQGSSTRPSPASKATRRSGA